MESETFTAFSTRRALKFCSALSTLVMLSNAATFDCKLDTTSWKFIGNTVRCSVDNFSFNPPRKKDRIEQVDFVENEALSPQVEVIEMSNQICPYIPRGWRKFFRHSIKGLMIYRSELTSVRAKDLKHFPKLIELNLQGNFIEVLPHDLFAHTPNIQSLNVRDNRISLVEANALSLVMNLREIDFTNNICVDDKSDGVDETYELTQIINVTCSESGNPVMYSINRRRHQLIFVFCLLFGTALTLTVLVFCLLTRCLKRKGKTVER
jgi:Leucine rich repeat